MKMENYGLFNLAKRVCGFGSALAALVCCLIPDILSAQNKVQQEADISQWIDKYFVKAEVPPFSFVYGGEKSETLIRNWKKTSTRLKSTKAGEQKILFSYTDNLTGLVIDYTVTSFTDFGAVELDMKLKNGSKTQTPVLESIKSTDYVISGIGKTTLHWSKGGVASFDDFMPQEKSFEKNGESLHFQPGGGRSSSDYLPFFNAAGENRGVIMAIGWTGEWGADFCSQAEGLSFKAGIQNTHLVLYPNEEIRMPKTLLLFYKGDRWDGQNLFRRFILAYHRPKVNGLPMNPPITWGVFGNTTAAVHLYNIGKFIEHNIPFDYYWVDAGWYGSATEGNWYLNTGNWNVVKEILPNGFKPLSEKLEKSGRHLMVWFEPERIHKGTPWYKEHPEWQLNSGNEENSLMNLGNPEARKFVTDFVSGKIKEFGLNTGCYRQDFNIEPLGLWQSSDAANRKGITEAKYVEGLYAYWDALAARFPSMIIDNCASGGRRIDLETTGRAVPYWRTDGPRDPVAHQCHSYGLMAWIPLSATSIDREGDTYEFRSSMNSSICINWQHSGDGTPWWNFPQDFPYDWAKKSLEQYKSIRDYYLGDYYPITPYSQSQDVWMAWQLNCPEKGEGMVQAFRRENCICTSACAKLRNLDSNAVYVVRSIDEEKGREMKGHELMEKGLPITIDSQPGAAVITYKKR